MTALQFVRSYQDRVVGWAVKCFGQNDVIDVPLRSWRFLEEALELVQATGCSKDEAMQLVDYVYGRPVGERKQEVGGTMTTLAVLCQAIGVDLEAAAEDELRRCVSRIDEIRKKHNAKPRFGPLPVAYDTVQRPLQTDHVSLQERGDTPDTKIQKD